MTRVTVQLQPGLGLPYAPEADRSLPADALAAWGQLAPSFGGTAPTLAPLIDEPTPQEIQDVMDFAANASGTPAPDLFRWYAVDPGPTDAESAAQQLTALPFVTQAAVERDPVELVNGPANPQFPNQRYLLAAPEGIDAQFAWTTLGGDGAGVQVVDVEYGWMPNHDDLVNVAVTVLGGIPSPTADHGTAVLGIVAAQDNTTGIVGIAPSAQLAMAPLRRVAGPGIVNPERNMPNALFRAVQQQSRNPSTPMVLLIEVGYPQPGNTTGDLPAEDEITVPDQIKMAIQAGMTVVEPAANGSLDLDQYTKNGAHPFDRATSDSGAIMVAGSGVGMSRMRRPSSNFGSRIDCFAWADGVRTCRFDSVLTNTYSDFSGTSAAGAIIAGAAAVLQGVAVARTGFKFTPARVRQLLSDPALNTTTVGTDTIGVMPDLRRIINSIPTGP